MKYVLEKVFSLKYVLKLTLFHILALHVTALGPAACASWRK